MIRVLLKLPRAVKLSALLLVLLAAFPAVNYVYDRYFDFDSWESERPRPFGESAYLSKVKGLGPWWESLPDNVDDQLRQTAATSNVHPSDYSGPESCARCHRENYENWSKHPHRWMNALADETTVKGDFSGEAHIEYLGGRGTFFREGGAYCMRLERGDVKRRYEITQTIGSRFFQYYVGRLIDGPEEDDHPARSKQHVLPFGYWLDARMWVPIVHMDVEAPDFDRADPFVEHIMSDEFFIYAERCNSCHTTFPLADMMSRNPQLMARHVPRKLHWHVEPYLKASRSDLWPGDQDPNDVSNRELGSLFRQMLGLDAPEHAVSLGISCEACHLGCKEHAAGKKKKPDFFPRSPHLYYEAGQDQPEMGRTHDNVNWACGRCHAGDRPKLAAGMSTWNSTEYTDAMRGSCYSQLTCITCHEPHQPIGKQWQQSPAADDARCLQCHAQYEPAQARAAHTHHPLGSEGSRCMNCHMPRLNEGLQDMVRTHMIFSPTEPRNIERNNPNACNMCHTKEPIDWTLNYLKEWYGKTYQESTFFESYPNREGPAALGWLASDDEAVRLIGSDVLARRGDRWALPELIDALDDPYLINRQFASRGLRNRLDIDVHRYGYRFYMMPDERKAPIERLRAAYLNDGAPPDDGSPAPPGEESR